MSNVKFDEQAKKLALEAIETDTLYELRCEHCGRFYGYYSLKHIGCGVLIYCKICKGWTVKKGSEKID